MPKDFKYNFLKEQGILNPKAQKVSDYLFQHYDFFDPRDIIQIKYEMIRSVEKEGVPITQATKNFGVSRPFFYKAQEEFQQGGIAGLIPRKRGPRQAHKLTPKVMSFVENILVQNKKTNSAALSKAIKEQFGFTVHSRSIERALEKRKKKQPLKN